MVVKTRVNNVMHAKTACVRVCLLARLPSRLGDRGRYPTFMNYEFRELETGDEHSIFMGFNAHYLFDDWFEHPLHGSAVWCCSCNRISVAESFEIDRSKNKLWKMRCLDIVAGRSSEWPYPGECPTRQQAALKLELRERFWRKFDERTVPPRCLCCAGVEFIHMELDGITELPDGRKLECTGWLTSSFSSEPSVEFNGNGERVG